VLRLALVAVALFLALKESATPPIPTRDACPADMLEVDGDYCPYVEQDCVRWLDPPNAEPKLRCAEFKPTVRCKTKTEKKRFCIDRYEWPNRAGALPAVSLTWYEAKRSCQAIGKRLCEDSEWTLACEGQERLPYPYGYTRNDDACNIDKTYRFPDNFVYDALATRAAEVARLDQREPSGSRASCVSPYGVHDMAGNVDEWVVNETCTPHCSGLKGGYWGPVRTRCRPMTVAHDEGFHYYQSGFRCCADHAE
jgi:formylglycine-generating enzyme required for sulfatase activity